MSDKTKQAIAEREARLHPKTLKKPAKPKAKG